MKKILSGLLVFLLAVTMFADSKETVDGIIEVADGSKFPAGHFGQAAGYLPGDSVFVTNPESGVTLQFLNLGTLDSAEGVVILLSEESAKTLGIEKHAGMRCKLDMRYGSFDETVVGKAVIDSADAKKVAKKAAPAKEEVKTEAPAETVVSAEELVPEEVAEELPAVAEAPAVVAGVPLFDGTESEEGEEELVEKAAAETEEPVVAVAEEEEEVPVTEGTAESAPEVAAVEEEIIEEYENEGDYLETRSAVEQPSPAELAEVEETSAENEEYAPIVLVPAEPVVPEPVAEAPAEPVSEPETETRSIVAEVVPVAEPEPVVAEPQPVVEESRAVVAAPVVKDSGWKSLVVESESKLARNCWYVQIASMNKEENIAACVNKYSKYPLALVPNGKGGYRILVGPLNVDEYGAVLAKFKSFGYKDAFLKKR